MDYIHIVFLFVVQWDMLFVDCVSLNTIKDDCKILENKTFVLDLIFEKRFSESSLIVKDLEMLQTEEEFLADPCFQHQMHLDITLKAIITIPRYMDLANRVKACSNNNFTISKTFRLEIEILD